MTIVDKIHGAELVTDKGKVYVFDAMECMRNYISQHNDLPVKTLLTNYYESPEAFIVASEAKYLISENLPSPMGANITAFKTDLEIDKLKLEKGGIRYTWNTLK